MVEILAGERLEGVTDGDSLDWKEIPASEITKRVTEKVQPGSIVLFHNAALHTPEALPAILETLLQKGYTFVPISQLILSGEYTIDHTGRQLPCTSEGYQTEWMRKNILKKLQSQNKKTPKITQVSLWFTG